MTWAQFAWNWKFNLSAFMQRFPHTPEQALEQARIGPTALSRVIAQNHDLTEPEAREELYRCYPKTRIFSWVMTRKLS
ncbi:hypothetical protein, partial [Planktotalea frisia]|uniref:hypothetical protein n=1 Tax=Planktotalea frisia TaxID=696762 RepID=UPI00111472F6